MIEFKIIASPDRSQQSTYQHAGNSLVIGSSEGDMVVDDPLLGETQLRVQITLTGATLENLNPHIEVRLNGKPIDGEAPLKERDNVTMGRTTINFSRLDQDPLEPPQPFVHPTAAERFAPGTKDHAIMEGLAILERRAGHGTGAMPPPPPGGGTPPPLPGAKPPRPPGPPPLPKK